MARARIRVFALPLLLGLAEASATAESLSIRLEDMSRTRTARDVGVAIEVLRSGDRASPVYSKEVPLSNGKASAQFKVKAASYTIRARSTGYWIRDIKVVVPPGRAVTVTEMMWPSTEIHFEPVTPVPPSLTDIVLLFRGAAPGHEPEGTVDCRSGTLKIICNTPSAAVDLVLKARGHIPEYFWDVDKEQPRRPLSVTLQEGTSLVGFVLNDDGMPANATSVFLRTAQGEAIRARRRSVMTEEDVATPVHGATPAFQSTTNRRGFFQLRNPPVGEYRVLATGENGTYGLVNVTILAGRDTGLKDFIHLERPYELAVTLKPETHPAGEPWSIELVRLTPFSAITTWIADTAGQAILDGVGRGQYSLAVLSNGQKYFQSSFEVDEAPGPLQITLPLMRVTGKITYGDTPLRAEIAFGAVSARPIVFESSQAGTFEGILPQRESGWMVTIVASEPPIRRTLRHVAVTLRGPGEGEVRIALGRSRLSGRVVDVLGMPTPALITLAPRGTSDDAVTQFPTGDDGSFRIDGMAPATFVIDAQTRDQRMSERQEVQLNENEASVTLVVTDPAEVHGRIVCCLPPRPVIGASVVALPMNAPLTIVPRHVTDQEGRFAVRLPPGAAAAAVAYWTPNHPLDVFGLEVAQWVAGSERTLGLAEVGGTLTVKRSATKAATETALIVRNGVALPLDFFATIRPGMMVSGGDAAGLVTVPNLAPGEYALCSISSSVPVVTRVHRLGDSCSRGYLAPGATLALAAAE